MDVLKVSAATPARGLAGAIAKTIRQHGYAELQAIGAAAVNQAVKAAAIAQTFLELDGLDIVLILTFTQVVIGDQEKTAMRFVIVAHHTEKGDNANNGAKSPDDHRCTGR